MNVRKFTAIALLLATAIFAQALAAVDHVHLDVVDDQACLICGSSVSAAVLSTSLVPAIVPAKTLQVTYNVLASRAPAVLDLRSRAPPISLDS